MKFRAARQNMVDSQVRPNGITDRRVIEALATVPREKFVPQQREEFAYVDENLLIKEEHPQRYLMAPMSFARLLQMAEIRPYDKVLIIGVGTGYSAAVTALIAAHVVAVENDTELLRSARAHLANQLNVTVCEGELAAGHAAAAPYDVILIDGLAEVVPAALCSQLAEGGRLVAPVGKPMLAALQIGVRADGNMSWSRGADCTVAPLPGFAAKVAEFVF